MLPFGVTIPATVPQRSEISEGLMNYHVLAEAEAMEMYRCDVSIVSPRRINTHKFKVLSLQ